MFIVSISNYLSECTAFIITWYLQSHIALPGHLKNIQSYDKPISHLSWRLSFIIKAALITNRKTLSASRLVGFEISKQSMPSIFDSSFFVDLLIPVVAMLSVVWQVMAFHYCDVIMGVMASQITSLAIYSTVYSYVDQRKRQSSVSLVFVRGLHRWPVNSRHKWPVNVSIWWCHHGSSAWTMQNFSTPIEIRTQISWKDIFAVLAISFPILWTFVTKNSR